MKQTKFFALIMATLVLGLTTSCGDDDEKKPTFDEGSGATSIKTIKNSDGNAVQLDEFHYNGTTCKYYYKAGRLHKMTGNTTNSTLINSPFKVSYQETIDGITYDQTTDITLDVDNDIKSYSVKEIVSQKNGLSQLTENATFTYGYSKEITRVELNGKYASTISPQDNSTYLYIIDFTWENGNLTKADVLEKVDDKEDRNTHSFYYSSQEYKSSQMPFNMVKNYILGGYSEAKQLFSFVPFIGFGKLPANIPTGISLSFNSDGTIHGENGCTYTYAKSN